MFIRKRTCFILLILSVFICGCGGSSQNESRTPVLEEEINATEVNIDKEKEAVSIEKEIQLENENPKIKLSSKRSNEIEDNHIGVHTEGFERYDDSEMVYSVGFKWIRIQSLTDFWGEGDSYKTFKIESIPLKVDDRINDYLDNGVGIVLDLWMGAGLKPRGTKFQNEEEILSYLDYVRFIVSHFKGRINHYQIWNEPGDISVSDYANLVNRTVPVIKKIDPDAKVIIPGLAVMSTDGFPGYGDTRRNFIDLVYLNALLRSGVTPIVDGISWHPFYGNIPTDPYYLNYPVMVANIKALAEAEGFMGEYYADEILWQSMEGSEGFPMGPPVNQRISAKLYLQAITMHRGLGVNVSINTFFQEPHTAPIKRLCNVLAGAEPVEINMKAEGDFSQYAFALPNGDKLISIWRNGEVVESDEGLSTSLFISDESIRNVVGINLINGYKQDLVFQAKDGKLAIHDLLVKDFPIFLLLIKE